MAEKTDVLIIGAGQAGLAASSELARRGIDHVVLERDRIGQSWRTLWNSFCLVTPNWFIRLPGGTYDGPEPDGYLPRDAIVAFLERYAASVHPRSAKAWRSRRLCLRPPGLWVHTSAGDLCARAVVVATGTYRRPYRPPKAFPPRRAGDRRVRLPRCGIASGRRRSGHRSWQTGCQIAEELHGGGREVVLACGRAPWAPRRVEVRDIVRWLVETPFLDQSIADLPTSAA